MPARSSRNVLALLLSVCVPVCLGSVAAAQVQQPTTADSHLAAPPALAKLVPTLDGWTRGEVRLNEVDAGPCNYTVVTASYAKGETRLKLTIADTGAHAESLMALASPVIILPEDYAETLQPATTVKRLKVDGSPAAEMWNAEKMTGELTVVVGGRFVVVIEALKGESLGALRTLLAAVDLKALAAVK